MTARISPTQSFAAGARTGLGIAVPVLIALAASAPSLAVLASLAAPFGETIRHVMSTIGPNYVAGTIALCFIVGSAAGALGVLAALLTALCDFPCRRLFSFALVFPLAVPAYIAAYAYADLLGPFGALSSLGLDIKNLPGAAFVLSLTLYPYAYLTARAAFASRSAAMIDTARTLGAGPARAALMLLLPAARPAIAGGVALIMMETAAEFGVADYFGVSTLSVGIFRTWHSFGDLAAASQLASGLFIFAALLVSVEALGRRGRMGDAPRVQAAGMRFALSGGAAVAASAFCGLLLFFGAALPAAALAAKLDPSAWSFASRGLSDAIANSFSIAGAGVAATLLLAVALSYAGRSTPHRAVRAAIRIATLGYAAPGAVIAIGILSVFGAVAALGGGHAFSAAGALALIYAYAVRFLTGGYNALSGGLSQIDAGLDAAARTLGASALRIIRAVHAPLLRRSLLAGATVVFVDIVKELPATLILRDFNFETLATRVYRLAGDERLAEAAPDALILIALGAAPIILFNALGERRR